MITEDSTAKDKVLLGTLGRIFGGVTAKILDFMIIHRNWDYSKQDLAKNSGVSLRHAILAIEKLEKHEFVKYTRNVGATHMYQLNLENDLIRQFVQCVRTMSEQEFQKEADKINNYQKQPVAAISV